jgi:hypothetical protein
MAAQGGASPLRSWAGRLYRSTVTVTLEADGVASRLRVSHDERRMAGIACTLLRWGFPHGVLQHSNAMALPRAGMNDSMSRTC